MYKVFLYNRSIILARNEKDINKSHAINVFHIKTFHDVSHHYFRFEQDRSIQNLTLYSDDFEQLTRHFFSLFEFVNAAGGLVKSGNNSFLLIYRRGKWDLPKGKVEKNESFKDSAIREVEEETGITNPRILRQLPSTFHIYRISNKRMLKRTYWYEMYVEEEQTLIPQTVEEITQAVWMNREEALQAGAETYYSLKELLNGYLNGDL